jgi:hypothetical protein
MVKKLNLMVDVMHEMPEFVEEQQVNNKKIIN